jgi:hypothetical protein
VYPAGSPEALADRGVLATKDHVYPQIFKTEADRRVRQSINIVTACQACNSVKGHYPPEPFKFFVKHCRGTPRFTHGEFRKFIYGLALAGFRAAYRDAARARPEPAPPPRGPQGRFTKRDLLRRTA